MPEHRKIRRSFTVFLRGVLLPKRIPDKDFSAYADLLEVDTMLAEKVKDWTRAWEKEGLRKGIRRGRREGIEEGIEQGLIQTVLRMLKKDMDIETVSDLLDLPLEKVKDISENRDKYTSDIDV